MLISQVQDIRLISLPLPPTKIASGVGRSAQASGPGPARPPGSARRNARPHYRGSTMRSSRSISMARSCRPRQSAPPRSPPTAALAARYPTPCSSSAVLQSSPANLPALRWSSAVPASAWIAVMPRPDCRTAMPSNFVPHGDRARPGLAHQDHHVQRGEILRGQLTSSCPRHALVGRARDSRKRNPRSNRSSGSSRPGPL